MRVLSTLNHDSSQRQNSRCWPFFAKHLCVGVKIQHIVNHIAEVAEGSHIKSVSLHTYRNAIPSEQNHLQHP